MKPQRIQRRRTKGYNMQAESMALNGLPAVSVCRPGRFGNSHPVDTICRWCGVSHTAAEAVEEYRKDVERHPEWIPIIISKLKGKNLACFCRLSDPCHADVLLEIANDSRADERTEGVI